MFQGLFVMDHFLALHIITEFHVELVNVHVFNHLLTGLKECLIELTHVIISHHAFSPYLQHRTLLTHILSIQQHVLVVFLQYRLQ